MGYTAVPLREDAKGRKYVDWADIDLAQKSSTEDDAVIAVSTDINFEEHVAVLTLNDETYEITEHDL